jgi:hypothetical protein
MISDSGEKPFDCVAYPPTRAAGEGSFKALYLLSPNQANSQNSTGPKTEAGKATSSQNSWKHGLTVGIFRVLATEDQFMYDLLRQALLAEYNPTTTTEAILVERMAQHHWMRTRAVHYQTACLESEDGLDTARLSLFMRYEAMQERAFHKCLADILKLRAERQKAEIGFASQAHKQEMHRLELLCRESDLSFHEARATGAQLTTDYKQQYQKTGIARPTDEVPTQKAA